MTLASASALAALTVIAVTLPSPAAIAKAQDEQRRPNVVVIMTDDQNVAEMRVLPNVKRLLTNRGVKFKKSFASNPICCPSRATYLSGRYAHNTGVFRNSPPNGGVEDFDDTRTLPVALQAAGYETAHVGKYLNGYGARTDPQAIPPGWNEWYGLLDYGTYRMYGYTLNENGALNTYGRFDVPNPANYQTDVLARKASGVIKRDAPGTQPFFLSIAPLAPHDEIDTSDDADIPPYPNPRPARRHRRAFARAQLPQGPAYDERDVSDKPAAIRRLRRFTRRDRTAQQRRYRSRRASLLAVDDLVARTVETLRRVGELDDTLILFTSDNGFLIGQHRVRSAKEYPYEESIGVPLVVRGPGVPAGKVRSSPAANVDLTPTILDYAGAEAAVPPDGQSLRPQIESGRLEPGRGILLENWCAIQAPCFDPEVPRYQGVRTNRFAYFEYPQTGERELYDLRRDPHQLRSRHAAPRYRSRRRVLSGLLDELRACSDASCRATPELALTHAATGRCASRVFVRVAGADVGDAVSARFFAASGPVQDRSRPLRIKLGRKDLRRSRSRITANVSMLDGRIETVGTALPRRC